MQLSQDSDANIRLESTFAFQALGNTRAIPSLKGLLRDGDKDVRDAAFDALSELQDAPLETAKAALKSTHDDIKHRALQKLIGKEQKKKPSEEAIDLLVEVLSDREQAVRNEAFKILWNLYPKNPESCLQSAFRSRIVDMRLKAIAESLSFLPADWVLDNLSEAINDPEQRVYETAYRALEEVYKKGEPKAQQIALGSKHQKLRLAAVESLGKRKRDVARDLLMEALEDKNHQVRSRALEHLTEKFPKDVDLFAEIAKGTFQDIRLQAASYLAKQGDERALEVVKLYLEDEREHVKPFTPPGLPETLSEEEVFQKTLEALPQKQRNKTSKYRKQLLDCMNELQSQQCVPYLQQLLQDPSKEISIASLKAIALCAGSEHTEFLKEKLQHKDADITRQMAQNLARLGQNDGLYLLEPSLHKGIDSAQISYFALGVTEQEQAISAALYKKGYSLSGLSLMLTYEYAGSKAGTSPTQLLQALSAPHPLIRFEAAQALAIRADREAFEAHILERLAKAVPEGENKKEKTKAEKLIGKLPSILNALSTDDSELRYAATQLLLLRDRPESFFKTLEKHERKLKFPKSAKRSKKDEVSSDLELKELAFGVYTGLSRLGASYETSEIEAQSKALEALTSFYEHSDFGEYLVLPPLQHALHTAEHQDVKNAALEALTTCLGADSLQPYRFALETPDSRLGLLALSKVFEKKDAGKSIQSQVIEILSEGIQSAQRDVRLQAAEYLQAYFPEDSLDAFIIILGSEHADVCLRVVDRLLGTKDDRVTEALVQALSSKHEELRLKAAQALAEQGKKESFDTLVEFLGSEDHSLQRKASQSMILLKAAGTIDAFVHRMEEDPEDTADHTNLIRSLGKLQDPEAAEPLRGYLRHEKYHIRQAACDALLQLAGPKEERDIEQFMGYLNDLLESKANNLRKKGMEELAKLDHKEVQPKLVSLLYDRDQEIGHYAIERIRSRIPKLDQNLEPLMPIIKHHDYTIRFESALLLADGGKQEAFPILLSAFQTSFEEDEQERALKAIGKLGNTRAFPVLWPLLQPEEEPHPAQELAAEVIGRVAPEDQKQATKELLQTYLEDEHSTSMQCHALKGICYVSGEEAVGILKNAVKQAEGWSGWQIRRTAAEQLGIYETPEAESLLVQLLNDDDSDVTDAAFASLKQRFGEDSLKAHLLFFDSQAAEHDGEEKAKSAKILAEKANPKDLLVRLSQTGASELTTKKDKDLFREGEVWPIFYAALAGRNQGAGEPKYLEPELHRMFENGILQRDPLPLNELIECLQATNPAEQINALQLLARAIPEISAKKTRTKALKAIQNMLLSLEERWDKVTSPPALLEHLWTIGLWTLSTLDQVSASSVAIKILESPEAPANARAQAAQCIGQAIKDGELTKKKDLQAATAALTDMASHVVEKVRRQVSWALAQLPTSLDGELLQELPLVPSGARHLLQDSESLSTKNVPASSDWWGAQTTQRDIIPSLIAQKRSDLLANQLGQESDEATKLSLIQALGRLADEKAIETLAELQKNEGEEDSVREAAYRCWQKAKRIARRAQKYSDSTSQSSQA